MNILPQLLVLMMINLFNHKTRLHMRVCFKKSMTVNKKSFLYFNNSSCKQGHWSPILLVLKRYETFIIAKSLSKLFDRSLKDYVFPIKLKIAIVIPLF